VLNGNFTLAVHQTKYIVSKSAQFLKQNFDFSAMGVSSIENTIFLTYTSMHYPRRNVEVTST